MFNKSFLKKEARKWLDEGLISQKSFDILSARYGFNFSKSEIILKILVFLFFGLCAITLVASNWDQIPKMMRFIGLLVLFCIVQISGALSIDKNLSRGLFFLGNIIFASSIALISQTFNLGGEEANIPLICSIFSIAFAIILKDEFNAILSIFMAITWLIMKYYQGIDIWYFIVFYIAASSYIFYFNKSKILLFAIIFAIYWSILLPEYNNEIDRSWLFDAAKKTVALSSLSYLVCDILDRYNQYMGKSFVKYFTLSILLFFVIIGDSYYNKNMLGYPSESGDIFVYFKPESLLDPYAFILYATCAASFLTRRFKAAIISVFFIIYTAFGYTYISTFATVLIILIGALSIASNSNKANFILSLALIFIGIIGLYFKLDGGYLLTGFIYFAIAILLLCLIKFKKRDNV